MTALVESEPITEMANGPAAATRRAVPRQEQFAQAIVTGILYAVPALICAKVASVSDPDIWWHLRSGEWIMQHHAVPKTDPFSIYGAGRPWEAYSWLFEVLVLQLFQRLGLVGIVVYTAGMMVAITAALHRLLRRANSDFTFAVLLTFVAALSLGRLYTPRPWQFTILFFVLELDILIQARRTGKLKELLWLPVIFAVWANVHIQFVDGLMVLALAGAEAIAAPWLHADRPRSWRGAELWVAAIFPICILATLMNPYGWRIYKVAHDLAAQPGVMDHIGELQAIPFRTLPDYCVLVLAMGAVAALAISRRVQVFETLLLAFAVFLSFRSQRDVWLVAAVASVLIAREFGAPKTDENRKRGEWFTATALMLVPLVTGTILVLGFRMLDVRNTRLGDDLARDLPVKAAAAIKAGGWKGPLYNDYGWGGYLMWSLRRPVSLDGRAALHGTERLERFTATWNAAPEWTADKDLAAAGVIVGPVKAPLVQVLRLDPRFRLAYEDKLSAVFVPSAATAKP